jgi:hypothetical protein
VTHLRGAASPCPRVPVSRCPASPRRGNNPRLTDPVHLPYDSISPSGAVAQLAERLARIQEATGSSPVSSTNRTNKLTSGRSLSTYPTRGQATTVPSHRLVKNLLFLLSSALIAPQSDVGTFSFYGKAKRPLAARQGHCREDRASGRIKRCHHRWSKEGVGECWDPTRHTSSRRA